MESQKIEQDVIDRFKQYFPGNKTSIRLFFAPGRVNLIGEHIDYNGGYVLPAALTIGTYMAVSSRQDYRFVIRSTNFPEEKVEFDLDNLAYDAKDGWGNYPKGIIRELTTLNLSLTGADILFKGNIPNGAGLSSSASIGMVTAFGLTQLADQKMGLTDLALLCQRMENNFIGVNTGIMDQMAVGLGEMNHAIFLNCDTLHFDKVPLNLGDYKIIITNTNKRRGLADSKYNERREQCQQGLKVLQQHQKTIEALADLSIDEFHHLEEYLDDSVIKARVRHVVTENQRVLLAKEYLMSDNLRGFGQLMIQSHVSLRDDYEVSGRELDILFESQQVAPGCIGTRMTGAGFGGCTVSLVDHSAIDQFKGQVENDYYRATGVKPTFYVTETGSGVRELEGVTI